MSDAAWGLLLLLPIAAFYMNDMTAAQRRNAQRQEEILGVLQEMRELLKKANSRLSSIEFYTERMPKIPSQDWDDD